MLHHKLSDDSAQRITAAGLEVDAVRRLISIALDEDLHNGPDVTTNSTVPAKQRSAGVFGLGRQVALQVWQLLVQFLTWCVVRRTWFLHRWLQMVRALNRALA